MAEDRIFELKTRQEFKKFIKQYKYVIVKFTASWCGPCKKIAPIVTELFNQMPSNIVMLIVDIDKAPDIKRFLKVTSVQTFCNFINGEMMDVNLGANKDDVINFFKKTVVRVSS